jgi:hypothetical protein
MVHANTIMSVLLGRMGGLKAEIDIQGIWEM